MHSQQKGACSISSPFCRFNIRGYRWIRCIENYSTVSTNHQSFINMNNSGVFELHFQKLFSFQIVAKQGCSDSLWRVVQDTKLELRERLVELDGNRSIREKSPYCFSFGWEFDFWMVRNYFGNSFFLNQLFSGFALWVYLMLYLIHLLVFHKLCSV